MSGLPRARSSGFTLLELIVTVAIFSILITLGFFMSFETFRGASHRSEVDVIVSLFQKARSRAMNNIEQSTWGVCYIAPNYVLLKGLVACDVAYVVDTVKANEVVAAASDFNTMFPVVIFLQLSGSTDETTVEVKQNARTSTISINEAGTIIW